MAYTDIDKPSDYFNTKLYTGNNTTDHAITGVGFKPDWVWIKSRGSTDQHNVYDIVRGATKRLVPNTTASEDTNTETIKSFDSDGFTLGNAGNVNDNFNYASWNWLASNTTASNTDGSITSTVSANTTSGFSIVSYTGSGTTSDTVGHGLGSIDCLIVKSRDEADSWFVKHKDLSSNHNLNLNQTVAQTNVTTAYSEGGLADLSGNTFGFLDGTSDANAVNESGEKHIAYCFKEVKGYSKFGSYTGNGNADGTFVYTGFRPAMVIFKNTNSVQDWVIKDNKRPGYNVTDDVLYPNGSYAEGSGADIDLLSNGFKARTTADNTNQSGSTFIYMCFAENPFVTSTGIPTTAR